MKFANEYDINQFLVTFDDEATPNLFRAAVVLNNLADWANENSDGWAYWPKPVRSAARLITLLEDASTAASLGMPARSAWRTGDFLADVTERDLTVAFAPIKSFLTRQGVAETAEVF